jgi:DNA-directed RNA polymerase I, II, and III subunit RPABC2
LETLKIEYKNIINIIYKMASDEETDGPYDEEVQDEEVDDETDTEEMTEYDDEEGVDETLDLEEEEDEIIEQPYQVKFKDDIRSDYLQKFHPEEIHKPFEEIYNLTIITRDENGVINDPLHTTYPILSKYEKTRVIGLRVSQLNKGATPFVTLNKVILDNVLIAEKELREKKIPFIIMRPIPNGISEYWNINDLEHI